MGWVTEMVTVSFWFFALVAAGVLVGQDMFSLLLGALIHEAGHLAAMLCCGGRIDRLVIGAFGAKIIPRHQRIPSAARELFILAAGPVAGLVAGGVASALGAAALAEANWFLSGFNLLPLPGLDGGSILALVMTRLLGEPGERIALWLGFAAILPLLALLMLAAT